MRYAVVIEQADGNLSAYVPDRLELRLPRLGDCVPKSGQLDLGAVAPRCWPLRSAIH